MGVGRSVGLGFVVGVIQFLVGFEFDLVLCGFLSMCLVGVWVAALEWVCDVVCLVGLLGQFAWVYCGCDSWL